MPRLVLAQAPVPDLTGYPSGLVSFAAVAYYGVSTDKDDLPNRRRAAGFGAEHLFRDRAIGPRINSDAYLKGVIINRNPWKHQQCCWGQLRCGNVPPMIEDNVLWINGQTDYSKICYGIRRHAKFSTTSIREGNHWFRN